MGKLSARGVNAIWDMRNFPVFIYFFIATAVWISITVFWLLIFKAYPEFEASFGGPFFSSLNIIVGLVFGGIYLRAVNGYAASARAYREGLGLCRSLAASIVTTIVCFEYIPKKASEVQDVRASQRSRGNLTRTSNIESLAQEPVDPTFVTQRRVPLGGLVVSQFEEEDKEGRQANSEVSNHVFTNFLERKIVYRATRWADCGSALPADLILFQASVLLQDVAAFLVWFPYSMWDVHYGIPTDWHESKAFIEAAPGFAEDLSAELGVVHGTSGPLDIALGALNQFTTRIRALSQIGLFPTDITVQELEANLRKLRDRLYDGDVGSHVRTHPLLKNYSAIAITLYFGLLSGLYVQTYGQDAIPVFLLAMYILLGAPLIRLWLKTPFQNVGASSMPVARWVAETSVAIDGLIKVYLPKEVQPPSFVPFDPTDGISRTPNRWGLGSASRAA